MKPKFQVFLLLLFLLSSSNIYCQIKDVSEADSAKVITPKIIKLITSTPLKDQGVTSTCWAFATTSFIETEAIRLGKKPVVLSPMFYVIPTYIDKLEKYIRMYGFTLIHEGDLTFSAMRAYRNYGAIPEAVYSGKLANVLLHDHTEMNNSLYKKARFYIDSCYGKMTRDGYRKDFENILVNTMGIIPEKFYYDGKEYTPMSFAKEMIGINPDDYVEITSFNHHPYYTKFILEIVANWNNNYYLNLPINDFIKVIDNSLQNNYSVGWDGDVSDTGYINGYAQLSGKYQNEKNITQQMRQEAFDNYTTKDDHNMHIIGIAEDDKGKIFYVIKNSQHKYCSKYFYMSREYLLLRTISVLVNKNAIPTEIMDKCKTLVN